MYAGVVTNRTALPALPRWRDVLKVKNGIVLVKIRLEAGSVPRAAIAVRNAPRSMAFAEDATAANNLARFSLGDDRAALGEPETTKRDRR
jgi:hypothetical protein